MMISDSLLMRRIVAVCLAGLFAFIAPYLWAAPARLSIEGISANVGEDEPRVLTILPWRAPTLPRRPRAELESTAPELVEPLDALVLERHRAFRQNLGVSNSGGQPGARR